MWIDRTWSCDFAIGKRFASYYTERYRTFQKRIVASSQRPTSIIPHVLVENMFRLTSMVESRVKYFSFITIYNLHKNRFYNISCKSETFAGTHLRCHKHIFVYLIVSRWQHFFDADGTWPLVLLHRLVQVDSFERDCRLLLQNCALVMTRWRLRLSHSVLICSLNTFRIEIRNNRWSDDQNFMFSDYIRCASFIHLLHNDVKLSDKNTFHEFFWNKC